MKSTIVVVGILALLIWAMTVQAVTTYTGTSLSSKALLLVQAATTYLWTGAVGNGMYLSGGNWTPEGPPFPPCKPIINNRETVTVKSLIGPPPSECIAYAGVGEGPMEVSGDSTLVLEEGCRVVGAFALGISGTKGTIIQNGGTWWAGGMADFTIGASGPGEYQLLGGVLGGEKDSGDGMGYFYIGYDSSVSGTFIMKPGTVARTRADYRMVTCNGTFTMDGGVVQTNTFWLGGEWSGTHDSNSVITWNINSTDVEIDIGRDYANPERDPGIKLGHHYADEYGPAVHINAPEGAPGQTGDPAQTVLITLDYGASFDNMYITPNGEDANVAGLNNITLKFLKDHPTGAPATHIEVAGKDIGPDVAGLCNNFALEGLIVGGEEGGDEASFLDLLDDYDNMGDGIEDNEALYVNVLKVNADSDLYLNGHNLYYYKSDGIEGVIHDDDHLIWIPWIPGDANWDVKVDDSDLSILLSNWGTGSEWGQGDFNDDGTVDDSDLSLLLSNWGDPCQLPASAGSSVPEPATMSLLGFGLAGILLRRRRK